MTSSQAFAALQKKYTTDQVMSVLKSLGIDIPAGNMTADQIWALTRMTVDSMFAGMDSFDSNRSYDGFEKGPDSWVNRSEGNCKK